MVLVPGLNCSPRLYREQVTTLWRFGPVQIADHTRADSMAEIAAQILNAAPPEFALIGLSMGGYLAFEMLRQARGRIRKLALLDTSARPDLPEQSARRDEQIAIARAGRFSEIPDLQFPLLVHKAHRNDPDLRRIVQEMAYETGAEAFMRQQTAIKTRPDSRPDLVSIACPTLVLVGEGDELTPPELAKEIATGIANACLVVIPDSGHLSTLEQPKAVNDALCLWMRG